jgi:serine/threonine protein kinase
MMCPSCNSPLEPTARFCGVCGYRLAPTRAPSTAPPSGGAPRSPLPRGGVVERVRSPADGRGPRAPSSSPVGGSRSPVASPASGTRSPSSTAAPGRQASGSPAPGRQRAASAGDPVTKAVLSAASPSPGKPQPARAAAKPRPKSGDEIYIDQVLNNRFKVESKIGEGGFGAVYRGVQLATGRKVALKLLHPEMTKDDNLVARFRREGMVLCNLRDAHTITTYDFDQTPDGTLYIAMELLEGKSLHQIFHEEAPLDWKRVFKILTEMCSSLAEAHAQGIVHRDLKPENIYLETRPGNPEFVKILDFGIAKVMRGDTIDPQSPQLTATGQTLGTLEYMSPEQLMGKPLDGRSDVYALGVLAYEMITGRLPFPEAKGPAGLITAQLKQTPIPPSQASAKATLPKAADRAILKCLEKDKNNRYPDVSALAVALQEVINTPASELQSQPGNRSASASLDMLETRRGDLPNMPPPPLPAPGMPAERSAGLAPMPPQSPVSMPPQQAPMHLPQQAPMRGAPPLAPAFAQRGQPPTPLPGPPSTFGHAPMAAGAGMHGGSMPMPRANVGFPQPQKYPSLHSAAPPSRKLVWWVIALLVVGAGVGTAMALLFSR